MPEPALLEYLSSFRDEVVHHCPNFGNAGDALIAHATYQLFQKCGVRYKHISRRGSAKGKVIMFGGGGNLVDYYVSGALRIAKFHREAKKLVILPQSINAHEDVLRKLGSNVDIICRERASFEFAKREAPSANVMLMDDLAFSVDTADTMKPLGVGNWIDPVFWAYRLKCAIAKPLLSTGGKPTKVDGVRKVVHCFRTDVEKTNRPLPPGNVDAARIFEIGYLHGETYARLVSHSFLHFLNQFDEIHTNRLHGCIGGILLGKTVYLHPNRYYKNQRVYEYSIRDRFPNVHWVDEPRLVASQ